MSLKVFHTMNGFLNMSIIFTKVEYVSAYNNSAILSHMHKWWIQQRQMSECPNKRYFALL